MMNFKKAQNNELNEDIYRPAFLTKTRLFFVGFFLLIIGFLVNFSIESKLNSILQKTLSSNANCPIIYERLEFKYFFPQVSLKRPTILGACFGNLASKLELDELRISLNSPSFYPLGLRFHIFTFKNSSRINLYPVISLFSQSVKIEKTLINGELLENITPSGISPAHGVFSIDGFFEFKSKAISDGALEIASNNFVLPAQNLNGFEIGKQEIKRFNFSAKVTAPNKLSIDTLQLGGANAPLNLKLKGEMTLNIHNFGNSLMKLDGNISFSPAALNEFAFLKLFLPASNTSGNYKLRLSGPLMNPGTPMIQ